MHIPVKDERGNIRMLNVIDEAVYIQVDRNGKLVFHTENDEYSLIRRIEDWASLVHAVNFLRVDRGTIVNLNKTWAFVSQLRVLRLEGDHRTIQIPVAEKSVARLKNARPNPWKRT